MQLEPSGQVGEGEEEVRSYKILVLGNSGAGKTSLVRRSVRDYFSRDYRFVLLLLCSVIFCTSINVSRRNISWSYCSFSAFLSELMLYFIIKYFRSARILFKKYFVQEKSEIIPWLLKGGCIRKTKRDIWCTMIYISGSHIFYGAFLMIEIRAQAFPYSEGKCKTGTTWQNQQMVSKLGDVSTPARCRSLLCTVWL